MGGIRAVGKAPMSNSDALSSSPAAAAQGAADFQWDGNRFEAGIGIAASGGGFRAMLFHAGALKRMAELGILSKAKRISSVSGGSIATAWLASQWDILAASNFTNMQDAFVAPILGRVDKLKRVLDSH
jgi:NTE family protein